MTQGNYRNGSAAPPTGIAKADPLLLALLLCGALFTGLIFVGIAPVLPAVARHFDGNGKGEALAQWVMTAPAIGLMLGGLFGGWLFDRLGPKHLLPGLLLAYGLAGSAGAILESPALLLTSRLIIGLCAVIISLGTTVLIAERFDEAMRVRMLGYKSAIAASTGIVGTLVAGHVAETLGWRAAFLVYAVALLFVIPATIALRRIPAIRPGAAQSAPAGNALASLLAGWPIYAGTILFGILVMAPLTQVPFLLREIDISGARTLSYILGFSSIGSAVGAFAYGHLFSLLGRQGILLSDMVMWMAGMILLGLTGSIGQTMIGCLLCGMAGGIFVVHMANLLVGKVAPESRGRAVGLLYVALFLGDFLTPLALLPLAAAFGRHMTFLLLAIPCAGVAAIVLVGMLRGHFRKTEPAIAR